MAVKVPNSCWSTAGFEESGRDSMQSSRRCGDVFGDTEGREEKTCHKLGEKMAKADNKVYGIDFGNSYVRISQLDPLGKATVIDNLEGDSKTPAIVAFCRGADGDVEILTGRAVWRRRTPGFNAEGRVSKIQAGRKGRSKGCRAGRGYQNNDHHKPEGICGWHEEIFADNS